MYAMTGQLIAQAGKRADLAGILLRASQLVAGMNGCHAYIVMEDSGNADAVSVFELWDDKPAHDASLQDERVRALIAEAMPLLAGAPGGAELRVLGGHGLPTKSVNEG